MKALIFLAILFHFTISIAAEGESRFHLFNMKCDSNAEVTSEGLDATPQSPPLDVDDPGTPGCNKWEINVLVNSDITKDEKDWNLPLLDMNYGIGENLQLKYEVPFVNKQTEENSVSAAGSSKLGLKIKFFDDEASKLQLAFYPQYEFSNRSAEEKGVETKGTTTILPLLLSKKIGENSKGDIVMTVNLSYNKTTKEDESDFVSTAVGTGLPLTTRTVLMGELSTEQALVKNSDDIRGQLVKANLGGISLVKKWLAVYGSIGKGLYSTDVQDHSYALIGIKILTDGFGNN